MVSRTKYKGEIAASAAAPVLQSIPVVGTVDSPDAYGAPLAAWTFAGSVQSRVPSGAVRRSGQRFGRAFFKKRQGPRFFLQHTKVLE